MITHHLPETGPQGFFTSDDERIYYESYGEGEVVVLCHGLGGNHAIWYQQVPVLAQSYRVVTWDQRGFGRSSNKTGQAGPATATRDLKALLDCLGVDQAHLVGQSMGGWAVAGFALAYPERTRSLILANTVAGIFTPAIKKAFDAFARALAAAPPPHKLPFGHHPAIGQQLTRQNLAQAFLYKQIGSTAEPPPANMPALLQKTAYPLEAVKRLDIPTLFVVGAHDPIFGPEMIREAASLLPNARVIEIPDTGHSPYFEAPQQWNEAVLAFLRETNLKE
ncbi:MAG: alpha/beta fold hydrolase [Anaerolineae bacterium]